MQKIRFAVIGPVTENSHDLIQEIKSRGHAASIMALDDINFVFSRGSFRAEWNGKNLAEKFDIFLLRAYNKNFQFAQILARILLKEKKTVIDDAIGNFFVPSKIFEASAFEKNLMNYPKTYQAISFQNWKKLLSRMSFPVIVKPIYGQKGQNISVLKTKGDYLSFFAANPQGYLAQEYLKVKDDMRVFIVGKKVLGAMKRNVPKGDFRANVSLGAKATKIVVTEEMKTLALKATRLLGYEIAGVDLIEHLNKLYIIEVNATPQWQKFKEVTGSNPAKEIINYAIIKYGKNQFKKSAKA
jgi:RimK family alpha-L-glutamate ligase